MLKQIRLMLAEDLREIRRLLVYHGEKAQQLREDEKRTISTLKEIGGYNVDALQERDGYIENLLRKIDELNGELFAVKKANSRLKGELRSVRRDFAKYRKEQKPKQHYKNGKRGTQYNG